MQAVDVNATSTSAPLPHRHPTYAGTGTADASARSTSVVSSATSKSAPTTFDRVAVHREVLRARHEEVVQVAELQRLADALLAGRSSVSAPSIIHMRPPPAPQQNVSLRLRGI